jgi:hypothetical protein
MTFSTENHGQIMVGMSGVKRQKWFVPCHATRVTINPSVSSYKVVLFIFCHSWNPSTLSYFKPDSIEFRDR